MTGPMIGANLADLDRLSHDLGSAADALASMEHDLTSRLGAPWQGPVADRFRSDWSHKHRPAMIAAARGLKDAQATIRKNRDEQAAASGEGHGVAGAAGVGSLGLNATVATIVANYFRRNGIDPSKPLTVAQVAAAVGLASRFETWLKHPELAANVDKTWGKTDSWSRDGSGKLGSADWNAKAEADYFVGAEAHGSAKLTASELSVSGGLAAGAMITGALQAQISQGPLTAKGKLAATAQARAYAEGSASVTKDGIKAHAEAGAVAGVSATASGDVAAGGVGAGGSVTAYTGAGATAKFDGQITAQKVEGTIKLGIAAGVGLGGEIHISVEPVKVANEVIDVGKKIGSFFGHHHH